MQGLKARNRYLLYVREVLENYIYEQRKLEQREILDNLILKNSDLLGGVRPTFMYKGTMHCAWYTTVCPGDNRLIHPSILGEIAHVIDFQDHDILIEESRVMNYVNKVLAIALHIDDLYQLIPDRIQQPITRVSGEQFNIGEPMSEDQITAFKTSNKTGLGAFKCLFLERLILS